jgi:hypothetical protein
MMAGTFPHMGLYAKYKARTESGQPISGCVDIYPSCLVHEIDHIKQQIISNLVSHLPKQNPQSCLDASSEILVAYARDDTFDSELVFKHYSINASQLPWSEYLLDDYLTAEDAIEHMFDHLVDIEDYIKTEDTIDPKTIRWLPFEIERFWGDFFLDQAFVYPIMMACALHGQWSSCWGRPSTFRPWMKAIEAEKKRISNIPALKSAFDRSGPALAFSNSASQEERLYALFYADENVLVANLGSKTDLHTLKLFRPEISMISKLGIASNTIKTEILKLIAS